MKKRIYLLFLVVFLINYSCGGETTTNITVNTPSTKVSSIYNLKVKKLCFGNKLKEKEYWNNRVVEISGDILSIDEESILLWEYKERNSESIEVFTDRNTIMKLNPNQKNVKFKGVLRVTGSGDKMCDTKTTYLTNGLML